MTTRKTTGTRARKRGAGRPKGEDRDLREHLLDVAALLFGRSGIEGTSLRAIATEARVTPAMLHYYFGDKAGFTQALIDERLLPAIVPLREHLEQAGDDPRALVEAFARGVGEIVARHPWLPPLWVREVLCEGGSLRELMFSRIVPNLPQLLAQRFAAAQARGRLGAGLDPRLLVVSLVGLTLFPAAGAPIWRRAFGAEGLGADVLLEHTLALLDHGVASADPGAST
jgi:AcrR family transcriptional regulator